MNHNLIIGLLIILTGCQNRENGIDHEQDDEVVKKVHEKIYITLGGEEQYVEMTGVSDQLPVLLFLPGGPGWPQTPHLRYFNDDLTKEMIVVSWDQSGSGLSYVKNPDPNRLSVESLLEDAHELTLYLKKKFNKEKIYLLGFSYGSVIGLQLAEKYPEDYHTYIGLSQIINSQKNFEISMQWLKEQALLKQDTTVLKQLELIDEQDSTVCKTILDCFMSKYQLLVEYNGTILNPEKAKEIEKAEHYYDDYNGYDWYNAFFYTNKRLGSEPFNTDISHIKSLKIPIIFMAGRHDWNLPGIVAKEFLDDVEAPKKKFMWFENSAHEPAEEEPDKFNEKIIEIVKSNKR